MAKDPAMLWYWSDWHSGTITLSRFLKGCYMDILHAQFNSGRLTLEEIKTVLGSDFGQAWPALQKKFAVDDTGKYFNERLELEKEKRANFTASRRKNLESSHMATHMHQHTEQRMENVNGNRIEIEDVNAIEKKIARAENVSRATIDDRLTDALDERYIDEQRVKWSHIDFDMELFAFLEKVRGSPDYYANHTTSGIRLAFQSQLRHAKKKTSNGKQHKHDRTQQNNNDLAIILQHAAGGGRKSQ